MTNIKLFESKEIRTHWDDNKQEWYFSVIDVIDVLTESNNPRRYWMDLKRNLESMGSQLYEDIVQLKLTAKDGKQRFTDVLDTKGILRLVQSIPSPNAEPFKMWLAEVGNERLEEIVDPELAILRGADFYRKKGYSEEWINQRIKAIEIRKKLTDEWKERGIIKPNDFAILTNELTKAWSGLSVKEYKRLKNLKKENLRDNMTDIELVLNLLAEVSTTMISKQEKPKGIKGNTDVAKRGGSIAKGAKDSIEKETKTKVVSSVNAKQLEKLETKDND